MGDPTGIIWPAFLPNQILVGNPYSNVALVCGWTQRRLMRQCLERIDPQIMNWISGIGQLYTAERGVDMMLRNLLANPRIDTVIFCGRDLSGAGREAEHFLNAGRKLEQDQMPSGVKYTRTDDGDRVRVWGDIPVELINEVRERTEWIDPFYGRSTNSMDDLELIVELIKKYYKNAANQEPLPEVHLFEPPKPDVALYPAPNSGHIIRAKTVADGWLELLHYIMAYGKRVATHYDQDTLEVMDLMMVITEQRARFDPDNPENIPEFLPFEWDHVKAYMNDLMSPEKKGDVTYTYGNLIRAHFGKDQFLATAQKLARDRDTRSAVISLWDPNNPMKGSPCLNHIWFRILDGKLNMTATIRSNDMFQAWPENAYGLRRMQIDMRDMILKYEGEFQSDENARNPIALGDLVIMSQSAHIYEDCWQRAKEIVEKYRKYSEWQDECGQWTIDYFERSEEYEGGGRSTECGVRASLFGPNGEPLAVIEGSPGTVRRQIAQRGLVSDVGHALYVGQMIERAWHDRRIK